MNIAIDGRTICQKQRGMPIYCDNLIWFLALSRPADQFYILINSGFEHNEPKNDYDRRLSRFRELANIHIVDIPSDGFMLWEQWLLPRAVKRLGIDLLHMPANRICLTTRVPQIATMHDAMEWKGLQFPKFALSKIRGWIYSVRKYLYVYLQYAVGLKRLKHIITISGYSQADIVASFPATRDKISYVYHGLPEMFANLSEPLPLKARKHVLMLGGESTHKNPHNMILAYASLPLALREQYPLVIVGINPVHLDRFTRWITEQAITDTCQLMTWVDEEALVDYFVHATALLFASVEEGFGFPLIQAMATGTPTVLSNAAVLLELSQGACEHAAHNDVAGLAAALQTLLSEPGYWIQKSAQMYQHSHAFTWDSSITKLSSIYAHKVLCHAE